MVVGKLEKLGVFGDDYDMIDGMGVCDYIYVVDLVFGYLKVLNCIVSDIGVYVFNFGIGNGYLVL